MTLKKIRILFRTSGGRAHNKEIGLGHVYRCMNLASKLKPNEIHFLLEDHGEAKEILIGQKYKNMSILKRDVNIENDIKKTIDYVKKKKIDLLIIDKYGIKIKYIKEVKKIVKTIIIADLRNIDFPADLIINGFIGFRNTTRKNKYGIKCLLGPKYQILNKKFVKKSKIRKKYDLLATFGGLDDHQVIEKFLSVLTKYSDKIRTKVILGPATIKSRKVMQLEKKIHVNLKIIQKTNNMQREMTQTRFGICSGGITSYEFAAMKIPFAIVCQVKHQLLTATEWQRKKIAINLGLSNNKIQMKIDRYLTDIIKNNIKIKDDNKQFIDGLGAQYVAKEILRLKPCINT